MSIKNNLSTKTELKIALEAMTLCGASCAGCFLTPEMRSRSNMWSSEQLDKAGKFIKEFIQYHEKQYTLDEIGINFGQGDYLQLTQEDIQLLMNKIDYWIEGKAAIFFTASGITNKERLKKSVDSFYELSLKNKHPLLFDLVLDSSKILKESTIQKVYQENISYLRSVFGYVDLNLNLGKDVIENLSPQNLKDLLVKNAVEFMTINYTPTKHALLNSETHLKILTWIREWLEISKNEIYKTNIVSTLKNLMANELQDIQQFSNHMNNVYKKEIFIDHDGFLFVQQEGLGDQPLTVRNSFKSILNIFNDGLSMSEVMIKIEEYSKKLNKEVILNFEKSKSCQTCEFKFVCMQSGVTGMKKVLGYDNYTSECNLELIPIYKTIESINNPENKIDNKFSKIYHQKDLQGSRLQEQLEKMNYKDDFILKS